MISVREIVADFDEVTRVQFEQLLIAPPFSVLVGKMRAKCAQLLLLIDEQVDDKTVAAEYRTAKAQYLFWVEMQGLIQQATKTERTTR